VRTTVVPKSFSTWLQRGLSGMWREVWRKWAVAYVTGLILLIRFRSVCEIGRRMAEGAVDALHHFIHDSPWNVERWNTNNSERLLIMQAKRERQCGW